MMSSLPSTQIRDSYDGSASWNSSSYSQSGSPSSVGYANHAHHEVEKLRRSDAERYRYEPTLVAKLSDQVVASPAANGRQEPMATQTGPMPNTNPTSARKPAPALAGARVADLREVLRFDVSPSWVIDRFSRVSTVLAELRLVAMRVPIVTGTRSTDLAGTLTYYFDANDKLQRITVHGFTGEPSRLASLATQTYGLSKEPSLEAGVYTKRWNGDPIHFFRLTYAPVVHSDAVHQKYTVFMELNQPDLAYGISREARRIVDSDRKSGRW